jgi:hypothetical protein
MELHTGSSGIELVAPVNNSAIVLDNTWTIYFYIKKHGTHDDPIRYTGTFSGAGTLAVYTLVGTEFPAGGLYDIEVHITKASFTDKCLVTVNVLQSEA